VKIILEEACTSFSEVFCSVEACIVEVLGEDLGVLFEIRGKDVIHEMILCGTQMEVSRWVGFIIEVLGTEEMSMDQR